MKTNRLFVRTAFAGGIALATLVGPAPPADAAWPEFRVAVLGKQYRLSGETGRFEYEGPAGVHHSEQRATEEARAARRAKGATSGRYAWFDQANLAVVLPKKGWAPAERSEDGPRARLVMKRSKPEVIVSLLAEPVGVEAEETNDSLLMASKEKMLGIPGAALLPDVQTLKTPSLEGYAYRATATFDNGKQCHYAIWVATKNGYNYSLVAYGDMRDEQAVDQTLREFVGRVHQIQSHRVAHFIDEPTVRR